MSTIPKSECQGPVAAALSPRSQGRAAAGQWMHNGHVCVCGVMFDRVSMPQVLQRVEQAIASRMPLAISVVNVAKAVHMRTDPLLRESVTSGDLVLADGMPLVWLSKLRPGSRPLPERVAGIDLMFQLFALADRRALRVYLLGARPETLQRVVEIARDRYARMVIAGHRDGYFADEQQEAIACNIRDARPDILLVAMSSPKKELFMKRWGSTMAVPVVHGVGGSFDVMAGVTRRAPGWMQRCGLEWFYRLAQEPGRMWKRYLATNAAFLRRAPACTWCGRAVPEHGKCPWAGNGNGNGNGNGHA